MAKQGMISVKGIDWTAPAVDIIDELVERYLTQKGIQNPNEYDLEDANAFAERVFTKRAQ